jgi:hypothetical protein
MHGADFCWDPEYRYIDHLANDDAIGALISFSEKVHSENTPELHKTINQFTKCKKEGIFAKRGSGRALKLCVVGVVEDVWWGRARTRQSRRS